MKKYIVSPITTFDEDEELWGTKVGLDGEGMPLHFTCWGKTEKESRERAAVLSLILNKEPEEVASSIFR